MVRVGVVPVGRMLRQGSPLGAMTSNVTPSGMGNCRTQMAKQSSAVVEPRIGHRAERGDQLPPLGERSLAVIGGHASMVACAGGESTPAVTRRTQVQSGSRLSANARGPSTRSALVAQARSMGLR
jgi:hypothetical protein